MASVTEALDVESLLQPLCRRSVLAGLVGGNCLWGRVPETYRRFQVADLLKRLAFGCWFDIPIALQVFPATLEEITFFVESCNREVGLTLWPCGLKRLTFGANNQMIDRIPLPPLLLGADFKPIDWPVSEGNNLGRPLQPAHRQSQVARVAGATCSKDGLQPAR